MEQVTIETARLLLRPFKANDKFEIKILAGNKNVSDTTLNVPHPYTLEMAEEWISSHAHDWQAKTRFTYAIVRKDTRILLGAISLAEIKGAEMELGYWVGEPYWNEGICTEAVTAILNFAFADLNIQKVTAEHLSTNPASGRVMQKNGMAYVSSKKILDRNNKEAEIEIYEISDV